MILDTLTYSILAVALVLSIAVFRLACSKSKPSQDKGRNDMRLTSDYTCQTKDITNIK